MEIIGYIYAAGYCWYMFCEQYAIAHYRRKGAAPPCPLWMTATVGLVWPFIALINCTSACVIIWADKRK